MTRQLSLSAFLSLIMTALVLGTLSAYTLGTALWIERRNENEQRATVALIASEATRVIQNSYAQHGRLLAAEVIQQLIHSRWVRDPDIVRISVQLPDLTIIADTVPALIGTRADGVTPESVNTALSRDTANPNSALRFVFPVQSSDRTDLCTLVILVSSKSVMTDFYLYIESALRIAIPALLILLVTIAGTGLWLSRTLLSRFDSPTLNSGDSAPEPASHEGLAKDMGAVIDQLELAATRLQDLAAR